MSYIKNLTWNHSYDYFSTRYRRWLTHLLKNNAAKLLEAKHLDFKNPYILYALNTGTNLFSEKEHLHFLEKHRISLSFHPNHPHLPYEKSDLWAYSDKESAIDKISNALDLIKDIAEAYTYVRTSLSLMHLKHSAYKKPRVSSRSISLIPLWCQIDNVPSYSTVEIASAILHEAIHNYTWFVEIDFPTVKTEYKDKKVKSPWTGDLITLGNLTHAVLVWFGLYEFYKKLAIDNEIKRLITSIELGFQSIESAFDSEIENATTIIFKEWKSEILKRLNLKSV